MKHPRWIRVTHWLNFPLLFLMIWSGLLIYWANDVYWPFFPKRFNELFGLEHRLAEGMAVHFTVMLLYIANGVAYTAGLLVTGEWRSLRGGAKFNPVQRLAYIGVLGLGVLSVLTGFAVYKPVRLVALTWPFGGYEGARFIHFIVMLAFVFFTCVHVIQVARAGWKNFRGMVVGVEVGGNARRSFLTLAASALVGSFGWFFLRGRTDEEGIPGPFRKILEAEGGFWAALQGKTIVAGTAPPKKKPVRENGSLGLESELSNWELKLELNGASQKALKLAELRALPRSEEVARFRCIEGWSEEFSYAGVRFSDYLAALDIRPPFPAYVGLVTPDEEYFVSIDLESMLHPQTLLAYEMNGEALNEAHGAPLRLIIPIKYGIKSLKRVGTIRLTEKRPPDYWESEGYDWYAGL